MNRRITTAIALWAALVGAAVGGETWIYLVDARYQAPLEFLRKTVKEKSLDQVVHYDIPGKVYIDNQPRAYSQYGEKKSLLGDDDDDVAGMAELEADLGTDGPAKSAVKSDARTKVEGGTGVRTLIAAGLADGKHLLHPGEIRFTVHNGEIQKHPSFVKTGPSSYNLLCHAVDLNIYPAGSRDGTKVTIFSGKHIVHQRVLYKKQPKILRIYLPASTRGYRVAVANQGTFSFAVSDTGVQLLGEPQLQAGYIVREENFAIGLKQLRSPQPAERVTIKGAELYLFTDRCRQTFMEGERVQFSVRAFGPAAAGDVAVQLRDGKEVLDLGRLPLDVAGKTASAELELDTALLRPGEYQLQAHAGKTKSNPFRLVITRAIPKTNMKIIGHGKWSGGSYPLDKLETLAACGFNQLTHGGADSHGCNLTNPRATGLGWYMRKEIPTDGDRFKDYRGANTPPEMLEVPHSHQTAAEFMLRHGIEQKPISGVHLILYFNVGNYWLDHAYNTYQTTQHLVQEWRRFPNFTGLVYCSGDGMTPATMGKVWATAGVANFDIIHGDRLKKLQEVFKAKVGDIEVDNAATEKEFARIGSQMDGAIGFGVGMEFKDRVKGDDGKRVEWYRWINDLYPRAYRNHREALRAIVPDATLTGGSSWGWGIKGGMHAPMLYKDSDWVNNDQHGDFGTLAFHNITESDYIAMRLDRPRARTREMIDLISQSWIPTGYKLFLQALSRNPVGIGVYNMHNGNAMAGSWGEQKERSEALAAIADLATRFGDVYMELDRKDEIAVIASFRQGVLGGQSVKQLNGAHYITQKAGYQATMITEAYCLKHPEDLHQRYRGLYLVNMTKPLPPRFKEVLTQFRRQGGLLVGDQASTAAIDDLVVVPGYEMRGSNMNDHWQIETDTRPLAKQFRQAVQPKLQSFFSTSKPFDFNFIRSIDGDLEYWVAFNDAKDAATGKENGVFSQFTYQGGTTMVTAQKKGVLYDGLRRQTVRTTPAETGIRFESDMRYFPGTVYVLAERPIATLTVEHSKQVRQGELLQLQTAALDPKQRAFTGHLPVEFVITDPNGKQRYHLFRRSNETVKLKVAGNDTPGNWRVKAVEQVTGLTAESSFTVVPKQQKPRLRKLQDMVLDADSVYDLVKQKEVEIVIYPDQLAGCDAIAAKLEKDLLAQGVKVSRRVVWPSLHRYYPTQWFYETVEDLEPREAVLNGEMVGHRVTGKNHKGHYIKGQQGEYAFYSKHTATAGTLYYKNVILLGRRDGASNPMLNLIQRSRMMLRNPSPSFPARGQGMVGYAWGPFHYSHDAVVVYGADEAGLRKAAKSLVQLVSGKRPERAYMPRPVVQGRENGQVYASMVDAVAVQKTTARGTERDRKSLMPPVYDRAIADVKQDAAGRVLIKQLLQEDQSGPDLVAIDLKSGEARQYVLDCDLSQFERMLSDELPMGRIPAPLHHHLGNDHLLPIAGGLGRVGPQGEVRWFYDPYPKPKEYDEAKYPRRCKIMQLSADRKWVLAGFYNSTPAAGHGTAVVNAGVLVWLNTKTGKPAARFPRYLASRIHLAPDGSRALILDDVCYGSLGHRDWYRPVLNPHENFVLSAFSRNGKELCHFPFEHGKADKLQVDPGITLALASFTDGRRNVTVYDLKTGKSTTVAHPRVDVGIAVAPDGKFGVITYTDGLVRWVDRHGKTLSENRLPAPGVPIVDAAGNVFVAAHNAKLYRLPKDAENTVAVDFGKASVVKPDRQPDTIMPGLIEPQRPWWQQLPKDVTALTLPKAPYPNAKTVAGEESVSVRVPPMKQEDLLLFAVTYKVEQPQDRLEVDLRIKDRTHRLFYPYLAQPKAIGIPIRSDEPGPVKITFRCPGGVRLSAGKLRHIKLGALGNAAYSPATAGSQVENAGVPRVFVYNVMGQLGDPRCEQLVYGFTVPRLKRGQELPTFPPGVTRKSKTNPNSYVDGKPYSGTPLYPTVYPLGQPSKGQAQPNLRSAQILIEYQKPRTIRGVGIWEHPGAEPVAAYALEACDKYEMSKKLNRVLEGNWRLIAAGRGNLDYFHAKFFKPHKAKVWRFTVIATPATVQRIAELELYQDAIDGLDSILSDDLDLD